MSWSSGEELMWQTWVLVRDFVPKDKRPETLEKIIENFADKDMDCGYLYEEIENYPELAPYLHKSDPELFDKNGKPIEENW